MNDAFVVGGVRTPRGKGSPKGALHALSPIDLVTHLLEHLRVPADAVEDLVLGCATQVDAQGSNIARTAALLAGWTTPGVTLNRFCASGLDAVATAASRVRAGDASLIVAGGVESVSRVPMLADRGPLYTDPAIAAKLGTVHMGVSADLVATLDGVTREALDDYADRSRTKARAAAKSLSLVPTNNLDHDELLDGAPDRATIAAFPALFGDPAGAAIAQARYPQATPLRHLHTKGNSPQLADAAALLTIADRATAERIGSPRARIVATATCAVDPVIMLTAGQLAAERVLEKAGLAPRDIAVFEFAEAFAALCLRFMRAFDVDHDRLNPNGGTIALGHAFGATGAILALNVVDELERRNERYGIACVSGAAGLGSAILFERMH